MIRYAIALAIAAASFAAAPARADDAAPGAQTATLHLTASLGGAAAPLDAGLHWRVFAAHRRPRRLAPARLRDAASTADDQAAAGRLCRPCRLRPRQRDEERFAGPRGAFRAARARRRRAADRGDAAGQADRSGEPLARDLRARAQQFAGQARLRQGACRRGHRAAGRDVSHRLDLSRHGRRRLGRRSPSRARRPMRPCPPTRSSPATSASRRARSST